MKKGMTFEESIARLEEIVAALDEEALSLEEGLKLYEEGVKLADACGKTLENARLKLETPPPQAQQPADGQKE